MKCISHAGNAAKQWTYSHYSCVATYCSYTAQLILLTYIDQRTEYVRYGRYTDLAASWTTSTIWRSQVGAGWSKITSNQDFHKTCSLASYNFNALHALSEQYRASLLLRYYNYVILEVIHVYIH